MTEASKGLRKAIVRNAGVSKLTTDELLAEMTDDQKAAIAASLAPAANAAAPAANAGNTPKPDAEAEDDEDDAEMMDKKKKSKKDGEEEYMDDDKAKAATDRAIAVMSSEHFAGREAQAKTLLANDKLSADEIITILADLKPAAPADPEAGARAEMQAALKDNAPSGIEANTTTPNSNPASKAEDVWAFATAKVFGPNNKAV
jgi:hypothetical protein